MSLELDERRVAMLGEMGIRWMRVAPPKSEPATPLQQPAPVVVRAPPPVSAEVPVAERVAAPRPAPVEAPPGAIDLLEWDALADAVSTCRACRLCEGRRHTVFGAGDPRADWLVVGDAPDEEEDQLGEPFAGTAGKLLDNMLKAVSLGRGKQVYITNVLKCRPPANRNPDPAEVAQCEPFLRRQVQLVSPRIILAMGRFAVQTLLGTTDPIGKLRGRAHSYHGIPVVVTYHPAYLLRNLPDKAKAWADLCLARDIVASQAAETGARPSGE